MCWSPPWGSGTTLSTSTVCRSVPGSSRAAVNLAAPPASGYAAVAIPGLRPRGRDEQHHLPSLAGGSRSARLATLRTMAWTARPGHPAFAADRRHPDRSHGGSECLLVGQPRPMLALGGRLQIQSCLIDGRENRSARIAFLHPSP